MVDKEFENLTNRLQAKANPKTKDWWNNYVKDGAPFLGVKMADIRAVVHDWYEEELKDKWHGEQLVTLAWNMFFLESSEHKLAGILLIQEILIPLGMISCRQHLDLFSRLFDSRGIDDWNICDWFCVKVLNTLIQKEGLGCAERISAWRTAENVWQARSSVVAFVGVAGNRQMYPFIEKACSALIRREARFAKTGVGWILREVSKYDQQFPGRFIDDNLRFFSRESLNNAIKNLSKNEQEVLSQRFKES